MVATQRLQDDTLLRARVWLEEELRKRGLEPVPETEPGPSSSTAAPAVVTTRPVSTAGSRGRTFASVAVMTEPLPSDWSQPEREQPGEAEEPRLLLSVEPPKKRREKRRYPHNRKEQPGEPTHSQDLFNSDISDFEALTSDEENDMDQLVCLDAPVSTPAAPAQRQSPTSSPLLDMTTLELEQHFQEGEPTAGQPGKQLSFSSFIIPEAADGAAVGGAVDIAASASPTLQDGVRTRRTVLGPQKVEPQTSVGRRVTRRPKRHISTPNKLRDWSLVITHKWVILGDSNVARFPTFDAEDLQIDAFPGAKWKHAEALLRSADIRSPVERLILSFGLNNRAQRSKGTQIVELKAALQVAFERFPDAQVLASEVNFGPLLSHREQAMVRHLNSFIRSCPGHLPALPEDFSTEQDGVHWTPATAAAILAHWHSVPKN